MKIFGICKGKKYVMLAIIMFLLIIAGIWNLGQDLKEARVDRSNAMQVTKSVANETVIPASSPDFFTEYRIERDKIRSERSDLLRESIKNAKNEEAHQKAQETVLKMIGDKQKEAEMENLIKAHGFADALVFIRDNSISAIIKTTSLSKEEVVQVADIISKVSGVKAEDISISAKP